MTSFILGGIMNKIVKFMAILVVLTFLIACNNLSLKKKALVVGMELSYPPFEMTNEKGEPDGISVELAYKIGERLKRPVKIENIAFDGLIPSLKTKKIDIILSSMTATEERAKSISFSDPYLETGLCLLLKNNSSITDISYLNAKDKTVVVKKATTGHLYAEKHLNLANILIVDKESSAVLEVLQGKADAFIYDQMSIYKNWKENESKTKAILRPFQKEFWAIGLRLNDNELRLQINQVLKDLKQEGYFDSLGVKYLNEQKQAFQELGYPFYF